MGRRTDKAGRHKPGASMIRRRAEKLTPERWAELDRLGVRW
ncbi:hypothetical protein AB0L10_45585 [Streptomyces flaveolus]